MELEEIRQAAHDAAEQLLQTAKVPEGGILVVGCSTSEVGGVHIGKGNLSCRAVLRAFEPCGYY